MARLIKVSASCRDLAVRGLLSLDEACRVAMVAALTPTLASAVSAVTSGALAAAAGLSLPDVPGQIERLRSLGFALEHVGPAGYRLTRPFDNLLMPEAVVPLLLERMDYSHPGTAGLPYHYLAQCASTNLRLKEQAAVSATGTTVVTDEQTAGRGRLGRTWSSTPGEDLAFSVLLRPSVSPAGASLFPLAAALATAETLEVLLGRQGRVLVKWPNDVLLDDRKVCGILLESSLEGEQVEWVVAGIGLNVNSDPDSLLERLEPKQREAWVGRPRPTSLRAEMGREVARGSLLADLLARLSFCWAATDSSEVLARLRARDALLGRWVQVFAGPAEGAIVAEGEAQGIGSQGELLVRDPGGRIVPVFAGEVTLNVDIPAA